MKKICHVEITDINMMPRVWRSAVAAKEAGYEVEVIGYGGNQKYRDIDYIGYDRPSGRFKRMLVISRKMVERAADSDADIVELHSPELLVYYKQLKKKGKIIVFNSHEFYGIQITQREYIPRMIRGVISRLYLMFETLICKRIDGVIYPCTVGGKNLFSGKARHTVKIENYPEEHREIQQAEKKMNTAVYAGALSEKRGTTTIVKAFDNINGKLYLAGEFSSKQYKDDILKMADPEKVCYLGILPRKELYEVYESCCVGVSLLKKTGQYDLIDNLSTKIYEYMQCGLPVVCSDFDYAKKTNEEYGFGITVDPDDIDGITGAINELFADEGMRQALGENGRSAVKRNFSWTIEKEKLMDFYSKIGRI